MFDGIHKLATRWIRRLRVPLCETPFVILFRERSGSTHLCALLNSHQDIHCRPEVFYFKKLSSAENDAAHSPRDREIDVHQRRLLLMDNQEVDNPTSNDVVRLLYDIFSTDHIACGFKFKFPNQIENFPEIKEELLCLGNRLKVIVLTRQNVLKQSVSRQNMVRIAEVVGHTNLFDSIDRENRTGLKTQSLEINVEKTVEYAMHLSQQSVEFEKSVTEIVSGGSSGDPGNGRSDRVYRVEYEDMLRDESGTLKGLLRFLGVDCDQELTSYVEKATPNNLRQAVSNYDELVAAVTGTELEQFLDE